MIHKKRSLQITVLKKSIIAYRSSVPKAMEWAAPAVAQVTAVGRPWRLGVLVDPDPAEPGASWQGASPGTFAAAMRQLDAAAAMRFAHSNYAGLVFESYAGLSAMEAAKRPP
jgi:hypothetical protein